MEEIILTCIKELRWPIVCLIVVYFVFKWKDDEEKQRIKQAMDQQRIHGVRLSKEREEMLKNPFKKQSQIIDI